MKLFLLSGLGADSRVFDYLELPGIEKYPIPWITPFTDESITDYAGRLAKNLKPNEPLNILGVSFGGIIAQEIAKRLSIRRIFIVSSVKSLTEVGLAFHITKRLGILKLINPKKLKAGMLKMSPGLFGLTSEFEKKLLKQIIEDTDEKFLLWAVRQIHNWRGSDSHREVIHIHGTKDKMFPIKKIKDCIPIQNGGHFMIVNRAEEISRIVLEKLK